MLLNALLLFVPLSMVLGWVLHAGPVWVFGAAVLAIVPLAEWIRRATEQMATIAGPAVGGLLNVTFGNVAELVLALFVLMEGQTLVVKGQITGAIIGNGLLGLGLAILAGSMARASQRFDREHAGLLSSLLMLAVVARLVPALFNYTERGVFASPDAGVLDERLSLGVSIVLILVYAANLLYTLVTRRGVYAAEHEGTGGSGDQGDGRSAASGIGDESGEDAEGAGDGRDVGSAPGAHAAGRAWPLWLALAVLVGGTALVAAESELVSSTLEPTAARLGLSTFFLGVVLLAVIGNAAEYLSAIYFARQGRMGLVLSITLGSTIQIALLVAPVLVIVSYLLGHPMNLVFENPLELIAIAAVAFVVNAIAEDGETNWFEGVLLLAVYAVLALAFLYATPPRS